jgi:hypothetical protein
LLQRIAHGARMIRTRAAAVKANRPETVGFRGATG